MYWAVGGKGRGGSGRRMVSPPVLSGGTVQPVLMSVTRAIFLSWLGIRRVTPRQPDRVGDGLRVRCAAPERNGSHVLTVGTLSPEP